jgi:hypothetical protein
MNIRRIMKKMTRPGEIRRSTAVLLVLISIVALFVSAVSALQLNSNATGTHNGFYYTFWKDSGDASMNLSDTQPGRYQSQWNNSTNNWVGGLGWNPGGPRTVNYQGYYGVDNSQNSYLALYGWTTNPLIEYYVIESYGSYNPATCSGGQDYGSFQSDGATYNVRRCLRQNAPCITGDNCTFYQYFSVRNPKKGFGSINGTITVQNHFNYWASQGLNLGNFDYMVFATEGYQSSGSSDITVSEGPITQPTITPPPTTTSEPSGSDIIVRARGVTGSEHINLRIGGSTVAGWTLTTSNADYVYSGNASGDLQVEFDNDSGDRDVILDYVYVNGETRQAEDMEYNTATYGNGECGGGSYSETMHCNGVIGFGDTDDCFSGNCNNIPPVTSTPIPPTATPGSGTGNIVVRARGTNGDEHINLIVGGSVVADWTLSTSNQNYAYNGNAAGDIQVEFDNDASGRDVILDYVIVYGETRQAENMEYNTATYGNGQCGGGSFSEMMHCNGVIGFGSTGVSPTVVPPTATPGSGVDPNFHIYLMIGQSNMEGQGQISAQDNQVPNGLLVMHADNNCSVGGASYGQWRTATPPLIRCYDVAHSWNNGGLGPGDYFGRTMLENSDPGVTIGLVGAAYQGQSIDFFLKNCAQLGTCNPQNPNGSVPLGQGGYAWMLDLAQRAQQDGVIKGIIFHQGESDTGDPAWPGKVNQMVTDLRNDLGIGNVPFIAGEMVPGACCTSHNTYVHQIETAVSNGHWVSASGLGARDEYHFNAEGYREIGRRYANKMLEVQGTTPQPTATPPTVVPPTATPPTVVPPTATPPTVVPPTATPGSGGGCSVDYTITNNWGSGFTANVIINSSSAVNGWTLNFSFPGNQNITNLWNGTYSQSGSAVTVNNAGWNGNIPANGSTSFGFQGTYSGSNAEPAAFSLNGSSCN